MSALIFVKTSSLGDVIHQMPAITDARRARPDAHIAWVVEYPYVPLVSQHPAVDVVFAVATRRWRRDWRAAPGEIRKTLGELRRRSYDEVIDTQGLLRTAVITRGIPGRRHGYDFASIREPLAALFYNVRHKVDFSLHAIDRNRLLTGAALGYVPQGEIDYGLPATRDAASPDYAVLLHGSAEVRKEWPEANWIAVAKDLQARGLRVILPWGTVRERERAERLGSELGAEVRGGEGLAEIARMIAGASLVIGLDTGLAHLAAAYRVPLITIFVASYPALTKPRGAGPITVLGDRNQSPDAATVISAIEPLLRA